MALTHKNLYSLIVEEIEKRATYPGGDTYGSQLTRSQVLGLSIPPIKGFSEDTDSILNAIMVLLKEIVPPHIKSGLTVIETTPISAKVTVKAGEGVLGDKIYRLRKDVTLDIPLDDSTYLFYINLYEDGLQVEKDIHPDKLSLAKIVIPKPGTTSYIQDQREEGGNSWNGWIVNFKEYKLYGGPNGDLEEDSIDVIRDNVVPFLASGLVGNITLNEDLKIINTAGTLELDSNSVKIYDDSENLLSKFNAKGTFFYDTDGVELGRFTGTDARIGNIKITTSTIQSDNFVEGETGFRIKDTGLAEFDDAVLRGTIYASAGEITGLLTIGDTDSTYLKIDGINKRIETSDFVSGFTGKGWRINTDKAEFNNIYARGAITTSVFEYDTISAVGGNLFVLNADVLDEDMTSSTNTMVISGKATFSVNDILRMKDGRNDEWLKVTNADDAPTYTVTRDFANQYSSGEDSPAWTEGTAVVDYGKDGSGGIFLTSSQTFSPYADFFVHDGEPWDDIEIKTRIGRLDGVAGCSGWGIYGGDGYLGALEIIDILAISSTGTIRSNLVGNYPYLEFGQRGLQLKDANTGASYGVGVYGTDKYGYGALVWVLNTDFGIPWAEFKEPKRGGDGTASFRLFNRVSDAAASAEKGDLINVGGYLKQCITAGTPGTYQFFTCSDGTTGGLNSAGIGNQYVEINVNGTTYRVLHDGAIGGL